MNRDVGWGRLFLLLGVLTLISGVAVFSTVLVAQRQWQWQETYQVFADFRTVSGLKAGDGVRIQGVNAGLVDAIQPPTEPNGLVRLRLRLDRQFQPLIRQDAVARIETQGVVGARVVEITPGTPGSEPVQPGGILISESPIAMDELVKEAALSLSRLNQLAQNANNGIQEIQTIAETINSGQGTIGRLLKDDEAYMNMIGLSRRGEKTLGELQENLAALKRTWPLSRYFNNRSFFDRDRVLFQPGSERNHMVIPAQDLFPVGHAELTDGGRNRLKQTGEWFNRLKHGNTEVVIAAFHTTENDTELAEVLSQHQAEAVRDFLVANYKLDSAGFFSTRKVAAVGFGRYTPAVYREQSKALPADRIEVILFTPQK